MTGAKPQPQKRSKRPLTPEEHKLREQVRKICDIIDDRDPTTMSRVRNILQRKGVDYIKDRLRETVAAQKGEGIILQPQRGKAATAQVFFYFCQLRWLDDVADIEDALAALDAATEPSRHS